MSYNVIGTAGNDTLNQASDSGLGTIALASGFGDISYFNLSFRTRFGMTPSDARVAATAYDGTPRLQ